MFCARAVLSMLPGVSQAWKKPFLKRSIKTSSAGSLFLFPFYSFDVALTVSTALLESSCSSSFLQCGGRTLRQWLVEKAILISSRDDNNSKVTLTVCSWEGITDSSIFSHRVSGFLTRKKSGWSSAEQFHGSSACSPEQLDARDTGPSKNIPRIFS